MKMTPRDALQYLLERSGMTMPMTVRDDNLTQEQVKLRESVQCLRELIQEKEAQTDDYVANARKYEDYKFRLEEVSAPREEKRGSGKQRIDTWKKEWKLK